MDQVAMPSCVPHDFPQLLQGPVRARVRRHIDMGQAARPALDDNKHIQHPERRSHSDEEVARENRLRMVLQEDGPALVTARLAWRSLWHVLTNRSRRDPNPIMTNHSPNGVYIAESGADPHAITGVDVNTAGMVGVGGGGPVESQLLAGYEQFITVFGAALASPAPEIRTRWIDDAVDGGQWWHLDVAVRAFFDNGGERLYVKGVICSDAASLRVDDFVTAIDAFEHFDAVSILLAPGLWSLEVHAALIAKCETSGRCFAVLDPPADADVARVRTFRAQRHSRFAALYFPWLEVIDVRTSERIALPPSPAVAGMYARVDRERGVFKAPANEVLRGVESVARAISHADAEALNREGINTIRAPGNAVKVWGARTLSDSEWKYVNVRRLLAYIEESIQKGTRWVVFEPNDEPLWISLRRSVLDFLSSLWRAGALAGSKEDEAFFVRCDRTTMSSTTSIADASCARSASRRCGQASSSCCASANGPPIAHPPIRTAAAPPTIRRSFHSTGLRTARRCAKRSVRAAAPECSCSRAPHPPERVARSPTRLRSYRSFRFIGSISRVW